MTSERVRFRTEASVAMSGHRQNSDLLHTLAIQSKICSY